MKKILLTLILSVFTLSIFAQNLHEFENSEIYLITCGPGDRIHSHFGHTAIRFKDDSKNLDLAYNFGVFDFRDPNFIPKFCRGKLNYKLAKGPFKLFLRSYIREKRVVIQQKLLISNDVKEKLYRTLEVNARPENKYFLYHFLKANCTTKVIDQLNQINSDVFSFYKEKTDAETTWRKEIDKYLRPSPWMDFGIDIVLGMPMDEKITASQRMFLPESYMESLTERFDGKFLGKKEYILTEAKELKRPFVTPGFVFWMLLGFIVFLFIKGHVKTYKTVTFTISLLSGIVGLVIVFLWFFTDHDTTINNFNLLWANPLNLVFYAFPKKIKIYYTKANSILLLLLLLFWWLIPQQLPVAAIPFVIILLLYFMYKRIRTI